MRGGGARIWILAALVGVCVPFSVSAIDPLKLESLAAATVLVLPVDTDNPARAHPTSQGSGTIIDKDEGLILTNHHVVSDEDTGHEYPFAIVEAMTGINRPPVPAFVAKVVALDTQYDIALLKIQDVIPSSPVKLSDLACYDIKNPATWRSVTDMHLDEELNVLGFPGIGDETLTVTTGKVSGFVNDQTSTDFPRAFIKTDTNISFGNSGGTAINSSGRLVGIPTQIESSGAGPSLGYVRAIDLALKLVNSYRQGRSQPSARAGGASPIWDNHAWASQLCQSELQRDAGRRVSGRRRERTSGTDRLEPQGHLREVHRDRDERHHGPTDRVEAG